MEEEMRTVSLFRDGMESARSFSAASCQCLKYVRNYNREDPVNTLLCEQKFAPFSFCE